jgi:hypothetical protein
MDWGALPALIVNWLTQVPQLAPRVPGGGGGVEVVYSLAAQKEPSAGSMATPL